MQPIKSKNIYAVKIAVCHIKSNAAGRNISTLKLTYPKFISVFCVKYTRKFTIVLSHLAIKYKLKYVHQFCK